MKPSDDQSSHDGPREDAGPGAHTGQQERPAPVTGPRRFGRTLALFALVVGVYALHQDFWNWQRIEPLSFGFLPVGLAYHIAYTFVAVLMMVVLVKFAWPAHLEKYEASEPSSPHPHREGKP